MIFMPGLADVFEISCSSRRSDAEQWPDDLARNISIVIFDENSWMNTAQPTQTCAANNAHEHGFSLVIERVAGNDFV